MNEALVQHAENDVHGNNRGNESESTSFASEDSNARAVPWKLVSMLAGMSRALRGLLDMLDRGAQ